MPHVSEVAGAALGWSCFKLTAWQNARNQHEKKRGLQGTSSWKGVWCTSCGDGHFKWDSILGSFMHKLLKHMKLEI